MTRKEYLGAFIAVQLALEEASRSDLPAQDVQKLAQQYGRSITNPTDIGKVLECIDVVRLLNLRK